MEKLVFFQISVKREKFQMVKLLYHSISGE